jgi:two-component system sensor histidine kinase HydH
LTDSNGRLAELAEKRFQEMQIANYRRTDRLFAVLMVAQFGFAVFLALVITPHSWAGAERTIHVHVYVALGLGAIVSSLPIILVITRPGEAVTRNVVAVAQMMWSAILIHLTGGRIETHFHVFGSLAFVAFYRDWRVLVPATIVVAGDHMLRQFFWPESVFGIANPEWWRFIEHAGWVVFEDIILVMSCIVGVREMREVGMHRAEVESSQDALVRNEKLAAVGQLAASVGHELRNPLAAVRTAAVYVGKRVKDGKADDPKVPQFLGVIERELGVCTKIISDLLDFARERQPEMSPCPLRGLIEDAIGVIPNPAQVKLVNEVPNDLPVPSLDKDQFRQVIVNLIQNAVEAIPAETKGRVLVTATVNANRGIRLTISDNGPGISKETVTQIFEPLFTTKTKGTGLGLAIVHSVLRRHGAEINVESEIGKGTTFHVDIAATVPQEVKAA